MVGICAFLPVVNVTPSMNVLFRVYINFHSTDLLWFAQVSRPLATSASGSPYFHKSLILLAKR